MQPLDQPLPAPFLRSLANKQQSWPQETMDTAKTHPRVAENRPWTQAKEAQLSRLHTIGENIGV